MVINIPELTELFEKVATLENRITTLERQLAAQQSPKNQKAWYSVKEAAEFLNVSPKTLYRLIDRGLIKRSLGIRHIKIPADALTEYKRISIS